MIARVRVAARATQAIHDEVNAELGVEFSEGFGDDGRGTLERAKAGRVDETEGATVERKGVGGEGFGAWTDVRGDGRLGDACDRIDKGAGADACLADYNDVENVLRVGTREFGGGDRMAMGMGIKGTRRTDAN